ncbi:unnamed protein product [Taenia asiatica]|uniref:Uncharacterized protein n=1 Tax=Taenia asiatica TaxID=60517 RepID=A0A0R3WHI3_TAEAS|nr:unnamed protein product [Taenia asiatica]
MCATVEVKEWEGRMGEKMVLPAAAALFGPGGEQPGRTHCAARFPRSDREKSTRSAATVPYHQLPHLNMVVRVAVRCGVV